MWGRHSRATHLLVDGAVAVPARHRLQHAAEEAAVAVRLVLRAAGHRVDDGREHLSTEPRVQLENQRLRVKKASKWKTFQSADAAGSRDCTLSLHLTKMLLIG